MGLFALPAYECLLPHSNELLVPLWANKQQAVVGYARTCLCAALSLYLFEGYILLVMKTVAWSCCCCCC